MPEITNLFCYGSLQLPVVMKMVTGNEFKGQPASVQGFVMYRMKNAEYPGIIHEGDATVTGIVYKSLEESDFRSLDAFEGDQYQRQLLDIRCEGKPVQKAWAYVVRDEKRHQLTRNPWSLSSFVANDFDQFLDRFVLSRRDLYCQD